MSKDSYSIKKVALCGNQNSGKTLLFNKLTGLNQKVGNWPGVTVDRKDGKIKGTDIVLTDLPGIYSLSPYTQEEKVSLDFLLRDDLDLIINIIDSTSLERSLYLTTQLMELGKKMILVLNMEDILKKQGKAINTEELQKRFNVPCISISALKKTGINELIDLVKEDKGLIPSFSYLSKDSKEVVKVIKEGLAKDVKNKDFIALKVFEKDERYFTEEMDHKFGEVISSFEQSHNITSLEELAKERYDYIETVRDACAYKKEISKASLKADKILLNKWAAIPIFVILMFLVYLLSVGIVGGTTVNFVDALFNGAPGFGEEDGGMIEIVLPFVEPIEAPFDCKGLGPIISDWIIESGGSDWVASLISDGVFAGVGAVCNFVPQIMILFFLLSLLETVGYMSRISFLFDRAFKKIGMSGKSLVPFIVGSGCSVPAIMGARTVENDKEHKMTVTLTPFIPCSAKLPIIMCFITGIFQPVLGGWSWIMTFLMYIMAILVIIAAGWILNKFVVKNTDSSYLSELPDYHLPSMGYVAKDVASKTWSFIKKAGTIIFLLSIIIWVLAKLNYQFQYIEFDEEVEGAAAEAINQSLLADIGRSISWIFAPMLGMEFNWGASVSAVQGLVAKEQVVSSMAVIAGLADDAEAASILAKDGFFGFFNGFSALGYMTFTLFSAPCFGAIGAMRRELGSRQAMWKAVLFQTGLAWVLASLIGIWGVFL